jgi:hypothetical protein
VSGSPARERPPGWRRPVLLALLAASLIANGALVRTLAREAPATGPGDAPAGGRAQAEGAGAGAKMAGGARRAADVRRTAGPVSPAAACAREVAALERELTERRTAAQPAGEGP